MNVEQRFPLSVRLIGVMHKGNSKVFMVSVLWSDQSDIIVYRSFQEFKKLHKQLKRKFRPQNQFRKSERVIPRFRARNGKFSNKGPNKAVLRLKFLEKYCSQLLSCDSSVVQSSEICQFFLPQNNDLHPDYAKNSIMIVPSDDLDQRPANGKRFSEGNITQPFMTETYRCVAPYETKDTKFRPFRVSVDERVDVLIKDKAGWWLVENEKKQLAWFPAPYLETCEEEEDDEEDHDQTEGGLYCATRGYKACKEDEVSVSIGSLVEVLQKSDDGWWLVRSKTRVGYMPSMYLQPYSHPHLRLQALHREMHASTMSLSQIPGHDAKNGRNWPRSQSFDLLVENRTFPTIQEEHKDDQSEASDSSFSDGGSSSGHDSLRTSNSSRRGSEDRSQVTIATPSPTTPKVPTRPNTQEIFKRCTTITRKAAMMYKANLHSAEEPMQIR